MYRLGKWFLLLRLLLLHQFYPFFVVGAVIGLFHKKEAELAHFRQLTIATDIERKGAVAHRGVARKELL